VIRVLIADDHKVVRQGLRFLLESEQGIEVAGEAADGVAAVEAVRALRPDVVLLDLLMPGLDGLGVLAAVNEDSARGGGGALSRDGALSGDTVAGRHAPAVIVLTSSAEDQHLVQAIRAGALSYLPKTAGVDQVIDAVRAAARGESVLQPAAMTRLLRELRHSGNDPLARLTPRETDVLKAIAQGRSNREIARELALSEETVKSHVSSILAKLGVADRTQAAILALQRHLVPLDQALGP
jgi:NarL family two-component system response regulator LiaR